jgi:hypothetical protein
MVSKVFKFECILYLFQALEVIEKKEKEKIGVGPLRPIRPNRVKATLSPKEWLERVAPTPRTLASSPRVDLRSPFRPVRFAAGGYRALTVVSRTGAAVYRGADGSARSRAVGAGVRPGLAVYRVGRRR